MCRTICLRVINDRCKFYAFEFSTSLAATLCAIAIPSKLHSGMFLVTNNFFVKSIEHWFHFNTRIPIVDAELGYVLNNQIFCVCRVNLLINFHKQYLRGVVAILSSIMPEPMRSSFNVKAPISPV